MATPTTTTLPAPPADITLQLSARLAKPLLATNPVFSPTTPQALAGLLRACQAEDPAQPRTAVPTSLAPWQALHHHWANDHTARMDSGIPLGTLNQALAKHGQWLPCLAPPTTPLYTLLAMDTLPLAAGLTPTLAGRYPRQWLLGMDTLYADGTVATSGGRVMKNVSGFDMAKLHTGSMGAYGVITHANLRLESHPQSLGAALLPVGTIADGIALANRLRTQHPSEQWLACELVPSLLTQPHTGIGLSLPWQLLVIVGGTRPAITTTLKALQQQTPQVLALTPAQWQPLAHTIASPHPLAIVTGYPSDIAHLSQVIDDHLQTSPYPLYSHSRPAAGMAFIRGEYPTQRGPLPDDWHHWWQGLQATLSPQYHCRITQPHPCPRWQTVIDTCNLPNDPAMLSLCAQLKHQFDPNHRFLSPLYPITGRAY